MPDEEGVVRRIEPEEPKEPKPEVEGGAILEGVGGWDRIVAPKAGVLVRIVGAAVRVCGARTLDCGAERVGARMRGAIVRAGVETRGAIVRAGVLTRGLAVDRCGAAGWTVGRDRFVAGEVR
jgi:hypothetical protein